MAELFRTWNILIYPDGIIIWYYPLVNIQKTLEKSTIFPWQTVSHNQMVINNVLHPNMWFLLRGIPCTIPICCFCCPHVQAWAIAWCVVLHSLWAVKMVWPCVRRCKECSKNRELYVISLILLLILRYIYIYIIDSIDIFRDSEWLWMKHFDPQPYHLHHYSMICCTKPVIGDIYIYIHIYVRIQ